MRHRLRPPPSDPHPRTRADVGVSVVRFTLCDVTTQTLDGLVEQGARPARPGSAIDRARSLARLQRESVAWSLLRADHAPVIIAILARHLGGTRRRLPVPTLVEAVEAELDGLRMEVDLPSDARTYCDNWRKAGYLVRRQTSGSRDEEYELSDGALLALYFAEGLGSRQGTVNASRLATIIERIHSLVIETDSDTASRLASLAAEKDRIAAQMEQVASGDFEPLGGEAALERVRDILALASELPVDFAKVRSEIEKVTSDLRRQVVEDVPSRGSILAEVFRGINLVADSEAGRSFDGFYTLVSDPEQSAGLEEDLDALLSRGFAADLGASRRRLARLLPSLQTASREIHDEMTVLSSSLRRFVQSHARGEYRVVDQALGRAVRAGVEAARVVQPGGKTGFHLSIPVVQAVSVGAMNLHNPARTAVAEALAIGEAAQVDLIDLARRARESDIDFAELEADVNAVLASRGPATIAEVLAARPARQSVASVVGLIVLALRHGVLLEEFQEVEWQGPDGLTRRGRVPLCLFKEEIT